MSSLDFHAIRSEFPALQGRTYLNTATYGQLPRRTVAAAAAHFERRDANACADFLTWFDDLDAVRDQVAQLIGASAADIAFFPAASYALGTVLNGIDWHDGDEIVTLENEFPNQLYAVESRQGVRGIVCRWEELLSAITSRTRLVLLSTVNYRTGFRPDLQPVLKELRRRGVLVYLDGTQSIGALLLNCRELEPDFLAVDAYKWLISPNGAGFLYVRPEVRQWLSPAVIGWRSDRAWREVEALHQGAPRFTGAAEKYEGGMLPFPSLYGMSASLSLIEEIGPAAIEQRVLELAATLRSELAGLGAEEFSSGPGALPSQILLVRLPAVDATALSATLEQQHVHISARRGYLRISPHFYNDETDLQRLLDAVRQCISTGRCLAGNA